jgi:hypothetical protein
MKKITNINPFFKCSLGILIFILFFVFVIFLGRNDVIKNHELEPICTVLTLISTLFIAFSGWYHERKKDRKSKQDDIRLEYLINAYKHIAMGADRDYTNEKNIDLKRKYEEGLCIIELYGNKEEIEEIRNITEKGYIPLLKILRNNLRKELELETIDDDIICLRVPKNRLWWP